MHTTKHIQKIRRSKSATPHDTQPNSSAANKGRHLVRRSSRRSVRQALRHYRGISVRP